MTKLKGKRIEVYREKSKLSKHLMIPDEWRWRVYRKGNITHASTEGYVRFSDCMKNLRPVVVGLRETDETRYPLIFVNPAPKSSKPRWWEQEGMAR